MENIISLSKLTIRKVLDGEEENLLRVLPKNRRRQRLPVLRSDVGKGICQPAEDDDIYTEETQPLPSSLSMLEGQHKS